MSWARNRPDIVIDPGRASSVPRSRSRRSTPTRLAAAREPGSIVSRSISCDWRLRTRTSGPGKHRSRSPTERAPPVRVPVATTPAPEIPNARSIHMRGRPVSVVGPAAASSAASASTRSSMPWPVTADTSTTGHDSATLPATCSSTSIFESSTRSESARSTRVIAMTPCATPRRSRTARCSSDCGIQPSSAATTNKATSSPPTPASMFLMNRSWPGTSTKPTASPPIGAQAKPRSMVRPRSFSSVHRSGSRPVSACTNVDLPWSTCPAVPMIGIRSRPTRRQQSRPHRGGRNADSPVRRRLFAPR